MRVNHPEEVRLDVYIVCLPNSLLGEFCRVPLVGQLGKRVETNISPRGLSKYPDSCYVPTKGWFTLPALSFKEVECVKNRTTYKYL